MNALREVDHNDHVDWILLKASLRSYGDPGDVDLDDLLESLCRDGLVECHSEQGSPQARLAQ
jgi:hypothetical protein